ncbi:hypothetical protein PMAYCL1PPCAC_12235, partial [Pristionchus mayeri]
LYSSMVAPSAAPPPMPKEIEITPEAITFYCGNAGKSTYCDIKIANKATKRAAFKVRCTSASVFRVQPPVGFVKASDALVVRLWFQNRRFIESTKHYFAVHVIYNENNTVPTEVFANKAVKADGVKRLGVTFSKAVPPAAAPGDDPKPPPSLMISPSIMPSVMAPSQAAPPPAAPPAAPAAAAAPA